MSARLAGLAFPFRIREGGVETAAGFEKVEQDVRHLLATRLGERTMRRAYGGGVHARLQEANDGTLHALVQHEIELALRTFVPDVRLTRPIEISATEEELRVSVDYTADPQDVVRRLEIAIP